MFKVDNEIQKRDDESKRSWGASHATVASILTALSPQIGAEIGVAFAGNAESILTNTTIGKLYLIDPYMNYRSYHDCMNLEQKVFDKTYLHVINKLQPFEGRYCLIRSFSSTVAKSWSDTLDFVFIDARHTYESVMSDILDWVPHVRVGGLICGHDYLHPHFPGVSKAVHDVFDEIGWFVRNEGEYVWAVEKQGEVNARELKSRLLSASVKRSIWWQTQKSRVASRLQLLRRLSMMQ
jgi:hypothetical protein